MELEPVPDEPALMADDILVVADLHIGLEEELQEKGIRVPSRAAGMGRKPMDLEARRGATIPRPRSATPWAPARSCRAGCGCRSCGSTNGIQGCPGKRSSSHHSTNCAAGCP